MCGIIYSKKLNKNEDANKLVIKRYEKQKIRGQEGYGYVELKNGYVVSEVRTQTEKEILEKLTKSTADEILFHHRTPTSTPNIIESTHPIKVSHKSFKYNYYVVHNGIISNDNELRSKHILQGYKYTTDLEKKFISRENVYSEMLWNDSEAVAIDLCQAIETGEEMTSSGSIAIVALQYEKKTGKAIAIYFGRNAGNPLKIENDKNFLSISSESGKEIKTDILYCYNYKTKKITEKVKKIGIFNYQSSYSYNYGMNLDDYDYVWDKKKNKHIFSDDIEEEDFTYNEKMTELEAIEAEIDDLQNEIQNAMISGDCELYEELENEFISLKKEYNLLKNENGLYNF